MLSVNVNNVQQRRKFVPIVIYGTPVRLPLDTASDITVIDRKTWQRIGSPELAPSLIIAHTASGANLAVDGNFMDIVSVADQTKRVNISFTPARLLLLGLDLIDKFSLWSTPIDQFCCQLTKSNSTHKSWQKRFPQVFGDTGLCTRANVSFKVKENSCLRSTQSS